MRHNFNRSVIVLMILCVILAGCSNGNDNSKSHSNSNKDEKNKTLHISAAASLTEVTKELETAFKKEHKGTEVTFNYGGSGALRHQIEKGAPVDVFMSANTKDVDVLKNNDKAQNTYEYAKNKLVLIGEKDSEYQSVKALNNDDKLAIGEVNSVPAGKYAEQYLKDNKLYKQIKPNLVFAKDVRQVLNYVEKGNAQLGYVYQTDLHQSQQNAKHDVKKINIVNMKHPIVYKSATTSDKKLAQAWIEFLKTEQAKEILKKYKFEV